MYDIIIVGAGPAGASAALFASKAGKKVVMVDDDRGMTKKAWLENYYGIMEISGPDMYETGIKQAKKFGTEVVDDSATNFTNDADGIEVETENGTYKGKHLIIASGALLTLSEAAGVNTKEGPEPRIRKVLDVDAKGKTNVENVWAAGTAAGVSVHAIITAGDGAKVAINVLSELNGERYVDHDILK